MGALKDELRWWEMCTAVRVCESEGFGQDEVLVALSSKLISRWYWGAIWLRSSVLAPNGSLCWFSRQGSGQCLESRAQEGHL